MTYGLKMFPALIGQNPQGAENDSKLNSGWLCGTVVERRSSAGVLSLSCARPVADG